MRIEVTLSSPVTPRISLATKPVPTPSLPPIQFPPQQSPAAASNSTAGAMHPALQASAAGSIQTGNNPSGPQNPTAIPSAESSQSNVGPEPGTQDIAGTLQQ